MNSYETASAPRCRSCGAVLEGPFCGICGLPAAYPVPQTIRQPSHERIWRRRRNTGFWVGLVACCTLAVLLFLALPIGAIVHSVVSRPAPTISGGNGGGDDGSGGWRGEYGWGDRGFGADGGQEEWDEDFWNEFYGSGELRPGNETAELRLDVLSTQRSDIYGMAPPGHLYLTVELRVTNIGVDTASYATTSFELVSYSGNLISPQTDAAMGASSALGEGRLLPGGFTDGNLVFLIPEEEFSFALYYSNPDNGEFIYYPLL